MPGGARRTDTRQPAPRPRVPALNHPGEFASSIEAADEPLFHAHPHPAYPCNSTRRACSAVPPSPDSSARNASSSWTMRAAVSAQAACASGAPVSPVRDRRETARYRRNGSGSGFWGCPDKVGLSARLLHEVTAGLFGSEADRSRNAAAPLSSHMRTSLRAAQRRESGKPQLTSASPSIISTISPW